MRPKKRLTAFYLETLLLMLAFTAVVLVLSRTFVAARESQAAADRLNSAVYLARNAAEAAAETGDAARLAELLAGGTPEEAAATALAVRYDDSLAPDDAGGMRLRMAWRDDDGLTAYTITVEDAVTGRLIYTLETAVYRGGDGP